MSTKDKKPVSKEGELTDQQLDKIAGGQEEVKKMGTIVVTAKRERPAEQVVKMGTVTVTAKRDSASSTQVASVDPNATKKN
jgi:hypothetical protein